MTRRKRRNHSPELKAKVAIADLKGDRTLGEMAQQVDVHPTQITDWKVQLLERSAVGFGESPAKEHGPDVQTMQAIQAKIVRNLPPVDHPNASDLTRQSHWTRPPISTC